MIYNKNNLAKFAAKHSRKSNFSRVARRATRQERKIR